MIKLKIDGKDVDVESGATVLDAATKLNIPIPTMCYRKACTPFTSCMLCVVNESRSGKLIPACSALAQDGMDIVTTSDEVFNFRKTALELLLSEHIGDCEGPCHRVCPAGINIPVMLRHIMANQMDLAAAEVAQAAGVGNDPCKDCTGPCEKACRRKQHDEAVSIKHLVRFALDHGTPGAATETGTRVKFNCSIGRLQQGEMEEFLKQASDAPRIEPSAGSTFTRDEAKRESARCLHCDCLKQNNCLLRSYSDEYGSKQRAYPAVDRKNFIQVRQHAEVVYEPGKCIKCGLCIQITERESEELGLSFVGRGFDVEVAVPFSMNMSEALKTSAEQCVEACPTAALSFKDGKRVDDDGDENG